MEQEKVTLDSIMDWMKEMVESKNPIKPSIYLDGAVKLNILLEDLDDEIALRRMELIKLESRQKRIVEHIRLSKKYSELKHYQ